MAAGAAEMTATGPNSPWTPERDAELIRLWAEGLSSAAIGRTIGLSKGSVISRSRRVPGCARRPSPIKATVPTMDKPKPVPKAKPVKPMPKLDGQSGHYTATGETTCRMIRGDDLHNPDWCPNPRLPGKAWCREDYPRVYRPAPSK